MSLLRALLVVSTLLVLPVHALVADSSTDVEDRTRAIATELRCVVCQNLSVADSPSEMAQQMRAIVREQVKAGKSPEEIKNFFVSKYGEWVLLKPKTSGFAALLWILPYLVFIVGLFAALWFLRRWSSARKARQASVAPTPIEERTRRELLSEEFAPADLEDSSQRANLLREQARLKGELADLEFDFQSAKLSEFDYSALKQEIETRAAAAIELLHALPIEAPAQGTVKEIASEKRPAAPARGPGPIRRWQLIAGGVFLMLFGLALGVMLTKSLRPRSSEGDLITGDFLTGTSAPSGDVRAAMDEGKRAFGNQELPKAIEAFKKVLAADPNNPEAHSYMGFILVQAGHGDGALMAFDKALSQAPNFPMALWGKGLVLYQDKKDYTAARDIFTRLMEIVPPGEERNEIAKMLGEIPTSGQTSRATPTARAESTPASSAQVSGKITIDPKLKAKLDPNAALFIIARPAEASGGPPLAVKKINRPSFPLDYNLSQQNVMMQGRPFTGKINITIRLDKDGNPVTRTPGDMSGDYKKNPVEVGTKNVDIVIDQETR